ncbi:hypothetical protein LZ30DRAFT_179734 [Colletotrichum cereale]|nr:hypothetical protein LZ30DRAFT_179734 [Colletotrichum cereale]
MWPDISVGFSPDWHLPPFPALPTSPLVSPRQKPAPGLSSNTEWKRTRYPMPTEAGPAAVVLSQPVRPINRYS